MNSTKKPASAQGPLRPASIGLLVLAAACTPSAPRPLQIEISAPPAASAPPSIADDPTLVSVTAARPPPKLAIDGDLGEWGSLLPEGEPAAPPAPEKLPGTAQQAPEVPLPSGPNPRNAASHLAFALTPDAVLIAAELSEAARDGIWLGVGSMAPAVLPIGVWSRGGSVEPLDCDYEQVYINEGNFEKGAAKPPEVVAACHALIAAHAALLVRHKARFSRLFKIDRQGLREVGADGALTVVAGAKAVFTPGQRGATVEITAPLTAMPRLVEAPLQTLHLVARAATTPTPDLTPAQWVWVRFPQPVSFEPLGEIRARALQFLVDNTYHAAGLSYHPADPLHVETLRYNATPSVVEPSEETLYSKLATLGDVEIGQVSAFGPWLAVLKNGKLVGSHKEPPDDLPFDAFPAPERKGIIPRDGALHVISYSMPANSEGVGPRQASWSAWVVAPDGTAHEAVEDIDLPWLWDDLTEFASADFETFGLRGSTHWPGAGPGQDSPDKPVGIEVTYRWDPARKTYLGTKKSIPVPKKPRPRPAKTKKKKK
ncbi:MAG: hypothetical protein ABJE95_05270 [Byssovorax sp.]